MLRAGLYVQTCALRIGEENEVVSASSQGIFCRSFCREGIEHDAPCFFRKGSVRIARDFNAGFVRSIWCRRVEDSYIIRTGRFEGAEIDGVVVETGGVDLKGVDLGGLLPLAIRNPSPRPHEGEARAGDNLPNADGVGASGKGKEAYTGADKAQKGIVKVTRFSSLATR
jgi:hypothetical protein